MNGNNSGPAGPNLSLREVIKEDLAIFFEYQLDKAANHMVAFTSKNPSDRMAYFAHWSKILVDPSVIARSIIFDKQLVGHISSFNQFGSRAVGYWLGREYWGQGLATMALHAFLKIVDYRPLSARVAKDNIGSIRVLEKCGFEVIGEDRGYANARQKEIEEYLLRLDRPR